jgi:hypothetical protein
LLYGLRQQGTSPLFIEDFRPAGRKSSIKGRKSTALPKAEARLGRRPRNSCFVEAV